MNKNEYCNITWKYLSHIWYLTEEEATVSMSTNLILLVRWKKGDSSPKKEEMLDMLVPEVAADCSNISWEKVKSETKIAQ